MLSFSEILGQIILDYHESTLSSGRDNRMVIPGLTTTIAREIHQYLLAKGITAYLVIGDDNLPDEAKSWIRPIGLTSKRIGSFVAVTCPGQLANIQDSIRGSGGAIRSVTFSEEWPWVDDGNESFRFDGPVLKNLVPQWTPDEDQQDWLSKFIIACLVNSTRSCSQRSYLLLEKILGSFSPSLYPELDDVRLKILFHCGIPKPTGDIPPVNDFTRTISRICERIVERCRKEDGVRQQALDMVANVVPSEKVDVVAEALNVLLDGIGQSITLDQSALAFFSCWGENVNYWLALDANLLERLFEVEIRESAEVTYDLRCDRAIISSQRNNIATFHGEKIFIPGTYKLPREELDQHTWYLRLLYRRSVLVEEAVCSVEGNFNFELDSAIFGNYSSGLPLKLALFADDDIRADARVKLYLCGPYRPALSVVEPGFEVIDASIRSEDEVPDKKIESKEPSHIYMFSYDLQEPVYKDVDENELPIIETGLEGIWRSGSKIDPLENASSQITRVCQFGALATIICFEARDVERGEFTLEDEMRVLVSGQREGNVKDLTKVFAGESREPYRRLGKINDCSRRRILLANDLTREGGWRPLLADLLGKNYEGAGQIGDYVSFRGIVEAPAFNNLLLPDQARELLKEYSSIRFSIIDAIRNNIDIGGYSSEHPDYAANPIFVDKCASEISLLLECYLLSYQKILGYIEQYRAILEWPQLFVMIYLDCIVHWANSSLRNSFLLVGPWHPLILAKRFMVQAALFARATALDKRNGKEFRQFSSLLKGTPGFRWLGGLQRNDRQIEQLYVSPTSDPGWHLAIKQDLPSIVAQTGLVSLVGILGQLRDNLGLESAIVQECKEGLVRSGAVNFMRAFPSRRSLGIRVRRGYSTSEVVSSLNDLLHGEEGPTELGVQLPGGIHLYAEESMGNIEGVKWIDPPIMVHHYEDDQECFQKTSPDIYLPAPNGWINFRPADEMYELPRSSDIKSVFSEPLCWLTEGQAGLPNSISLEFDNQPEEPGGLGATFVGTTARVCNILQNRVVVVRSVELPQRMSCPWAIIPGSELDPAILVKYVRDGSARSLQERALWDYRLNIAGTMNSYYVLSTIPQGFSVAVNGFFQKGEVAAKFIEDLGSLGIAIGGEALKSGRHALGVIGLVGAIRLLKDTEGKLKSIFQEGEDRIGFLIPIDAFISFFGGKARLQGENGNDMKRTDLLAIQLVLPKDNDANLSIYACGIESKFVSHTLGQARAIEALGQARSSLGQFRTLVETSKEEWAMPERLGLLAIIRFGLRITSLGRQGNTSNNEIEAEQSVFQAILQGRYEYKQALRDAIVVSTEGQLPGVAEINFLQDGIWVRINRDHWPGINETPQLENIRDELSRLFDVPGDTQDIPGGDDNVPPANVGAKETTEVSVKESLMTTGESLEPVAHESSIGVSAGPETNKGVPVLESAPLRRILIGVDDARRPIYFDPQSPVDPLDNLNLMITGSSGTGKTQLLKYLLCRLREQGKNVLVLDFKNDFASDPVFSSKASLDRVFVSFDGLPFNPLIPYPVLHPGTGKLVIQAGQHISGVVSVLKRTYGLGAQQQIAVKNAIVDSFTAMGIQTTGTVPFERLMKFPDFNSVGTVLECLNPRAYNRLDPLFALELFRPEYQQDSFSNLVNRSMILDLSQIPSDEIKNTIAELIILSAHAFYNAQPHSGYIRQFLVFDEAHRVLASDFMANLIRECRAYGVGTILSSQYPDDFPGQLSSSMATKVLHGNGRDAEKVRAIIQMIGCAGREAEVSNLDRFQAFIDNRHYPHTLIRTVNYPLYIILSYLQTTREATRDSLAAIEGIHTDKLPLGNLVKQLERLGLVEEREGCIRLLRFHE